MTRQERCELIRASKLVAIIRATKLSSEDLITMAQTLRDAGVCVMEVTLTTPNALGLLSDAKKALGSDILFGVGSVLNTEQAEASIRAGADLIVTPTLSLPVIELANRAATPILPGCYTPTEAQTAYEAGADFIKLFPAEFGGPAFVKAILAPLPHLPLIPVGGVTPDTAKAFLQAGAVGLGVGSSLVNQKRIDERDWNGLRDEALRFGNAIRTL